MRAGTWDAACPRPRCPRITNLARKQEVTHNHTVEAMDGVVRNFGRGKGLQLRLELGNVVTGEGEVEGRRVVGDSTDKVWEGKPMCVRESRRV